MTDRSSLFGSPVPEQDESPTALSRQLSSSVQNNSIAVPNETNKSLRTNEEVIVRPQATPAI